MTEAVESLTSSSHSPSSSSPSTSAPPPTWSDLNRLHSTSTVACVPSSLQSLVEWIGLEGGKQGCAAPHLLNLVHRHVRAIDCPSSTRALTSTSPSHEPPLDLSVMEYWWKHLRHHSSLSFYSSEADWPPSPVDVAPPKAKAYSKAKIARAHQTKSLQMTEDGILFHPFQRSAPPPR